jgi:hypothetical protein
MKPISFISKRSIKKSSGFKGSAVQRLGALINTEYANPYPKKITLNGEPEPRATIRPSFS